MLTQELVRKVFHYDPTTGGLIRRSGIMAGLTAGGKNAKGYWVVYVNGTRHYAHRVIWLYVYGVLPRQVDHINRDKADNRLANLREATDAQNQANNGPQKNNRSGFRGVSPSKGKWRAVVTVNAKQKWLGYYDTPEEAAAAYRRAAVEAFGEFAE